MKIFNNVEGARVPKSKFDLSHEKKISMNMNNLVPCFLEEIVPGDNFKVTTEMMVRLQPLMAPMMHRLKAKIEFYFVPNRLVYDKWQEYITGGEEGDSTEEAPYFNITQPGGWGPDFFKEGTLADYMGIPPFNPDIMGPATALKISSLPFRAYQLIYNEYYRDQNLQPKVVINKTGGNDGAAAAGLLTIRQRAWEKDYFTSSLDRAQKGNPVVMPIEGTGIGIPNYKLASVIKDPNTGGPAGAGNLAGANNAGITQVTGGVAQDFVSIENIDDVTVNVDNAGTTINDLRVALRAQEFLEKFMRAGSRYIEVILSFFGILGSDARLQRPEFLGGGMTPIVVSEVLSTYQQADDTGYPQGNMTGHGIGAGANQGFKRTFEEHGFVIGLLSVIPTTAYQQGIPKMFSRVDKEDYYWPTFANLGEQEVKNKELYFDPFGTLNEGTFGYQSRYAEYKYKSSTVHGAFRSSLAYWHMGRIFSNLPTLTEQFIKADATKRIFPVELADEEALLIQIYHNVSAIRPMPYYGTPRT